MCIVHGIVYTKAKDGLHSLVGQRSEEVAAVLHLVQKHLVSHGPP
jgi:hypothetical protein